jgi:hypothetical protein
MAHSGARCARASGRRRLLKPARGGEAVCGGSVRAMARHGLPWRGDMQERRSNGVWRWRSPVSGGLPRGADHGPACVTHRGEKGAAHGPTDAGRPRRACTASYGGETDVAGRDVARAPAFPRVLGAKPFGVASFKMVFLKISELKWANI